jgi:hypothetical protein
MSLALCVVDLLKIGIRLCFMCQGLRDVAAMSWPSLGGEFELMLLRLPSVGL